MEIISTREAPQAIGPYSQAIRTGQFVFASGQIGMDPDTGDMVRGGVQPETEQAIANIRAVLAEAGASLDKVVQATVFLADMDDFAAMNEVYAREFGAWKPARACVAAKSLPKGARVEIAVVAVVE